MNKLRFFAVFLLVGIALTLAAQQAVAPPPRPATDAPANAEVLKLLRAGMPESVVVNKIRATTDKFDASADALVTLKQAGATEAELKAIMAQGAASAEQQPASAPDAAPAASGPTLAETMKFIQEKMNEQGKINYALYTHDNSDGQDWPVYQISIETTNFVADPATCRITWHKVTTNGGNVGMNKDLSLDLNNVQTFEVRTSIQEAKMEDTAGGHPGLDKRQDPPYFSLTARLKGNAETPLFFRDEEMANRVAKAMLHAVELCGGGSKDPF
jgi:hypothetical protein